MIVFETRGDIFDTSLQTLVCPVNTEGVMGAGLALKFSQRFPGLLAAYRHACRRRVFKREKYFVWSQSEHVKVLCFPSKQAWRNPSQLLWIDEALEAIAETYWKHGISSLAIPGIGAGLGRLDWENVRELIYKHLQASPLKVGIYSP